MDSPRHRPIPAPPPFSVFYYQSISATAQRVSLLPIHQLQPPWWYKGLPYLQTQYIHRIEPTPPPAYVLVWSQSVPTESTTQLSVWTRGHLFPKAPLNAPVHIFDLDHTIGIVHSCVYLSSINAKILERQDSTVSLSGMLFEVCQTVGDT